MERDAHPSPLHIHKSRVRGRGLRALPIAVPGGALVTLAQTKVTEKQSDGHAVHLAGDLTKVGRRHKTSNLSCHLLLYNILPVLSTDVCIGRGQGRGTEAWQAALYNVTKMFTFYLWIVLILPLTLGEFVLL